MQTASLAARLGGPLLILALAAAVPIHRVLLASDTSMALWNLDLLTYFYPLASFLHDELQQGRLPLWNPYQFAGQPLLAFHTTGLLYPPNLVLLSLLDPGPALVLHFALHLLVAGVFTSLYAARLGLSPSACTAAAVAFMLSAAMLNGLANTSLISTAAWLPAVLWALHGLACEARARWGGLLAVFLSLAFLGGQAQETLYMLQFGLVYGMFLLFTATPKAARGRVIGLALASGILAFGLVAPQLLPAVELATQSIHGLGGISSDDAAIGSLELSNLLIALVGGIPADEGLLSSETGIARLPFLAFPLGLLALFLRRDRREAAFLSLSLVACALFMLGSNGPIFENYHSLPLGSLFRIPVRLGFLYQLLFAVLMASGIDALCARLAAVPARRRLAEGVAIALLLLVAADQYSSIDFPGAHPARSLATDRAAPELGQFARALPGRERLFLQHPGELPWRDLPLKSGMMGGFFAVPDYEPNMPADYARYFERAFPWPGLLNIRSKRLPGGPPPTQRALDLMRARYYVTPRPGPSRLESFSGGRRFRVGNLGIFERKEALPRTYAVRQVSRAVDLDDAMTRVMREDFRLRDEAIVVSSDAAERVAEPACSAAPDRAAIESYLAHEVRIRASCECECLLVLTDLHYPGWQVRVDGEERPIHRVNAIYRGVDLSTGKHEVVYSYEPQSLRTGVLLLVVAGTVGLAALGFIARRPLPSPL